MTEHEYGNHRVRPAPVTPGLSVQPNKGDRGGYTGRAQRVQPLFPYGLHRCTLVLKKVVARGCTPVARRSHAEFAARMEALQTATVVPVPRPSFPRRGHHSAPR
jgi:hypothetical protein